MTKVVIAGSWLVVPAFIFEEFIFYSDEVIVCCGNGLQQGLFTVLVFGKQIFQPRHLLLIMLHLNNLPGQTPLLISQRWL